MRQHGKRLFRLPLRRLLAGLLCAVTLCGLLPEGISLTGSAQAAEVILPWSDEDLETLHSYNIMNGNENGDMMPNKAIWRSEIAGLINRALGYQEKAPKLPFTDVVDKDWFADDISIAYQMGYLSGTGKNTVSPNWPLTREQALVTLCKNLMLQPAVGESFHFADSHSFSTWSRGYIKPAVEAGLIDANSTANFNPSKQITRGELAGMVLRAIGTPVQTSGVKNLGTVNGNVTITASNVTLRNTTINGDLYLTGGIGLGNVQLDNVIVNGRIVDSGAGLSEKGEISVTMNNVTADELIVDSMRNQRISLSAKGKTLIPKTSVRTPASLEDSTAASYGLRLIEIDGEEKTAVTLSGNIKEVHDKTVNSTLIIGDGVADKITVDESAVGTSVDVGKDARIKSLNLDTGTKVTGSGTVDSLTVSATGTTVTLTQMPDEIVVAPGITANINKQKMDSAAAAEASAQPRLMPGYPYADDVVSTSVKALFKTNKPGTVYWVLTAKADGSPNEEDIISPTGYAKKIKAGSIKISDSSKEYSTKITGLTSDGSYYLSALMVDSKGVRSTMKVTAFTTPDNTTPAFSKGYPVEAQISEQDAQFAFMTTKDCYLYYTVLPKGSSAPRAIDFKTGNISGNMGYGIVKMAKNSPAFVFVNDVSLDEKAPYVLYLWLEDLDGAKSSAVKSMNFTTQDRTPPIVSNLRQSGSTVSAVSAGYVLNEPGTLYWAVVTAGDKSFMGTPAPGYTASNWLQSQTAKERLAAGTGALKSGKSAVTAAKVGTDVSFTVSGLSAKTTGTSSYDLYYAAKDSAGNWSDVIRYVTVYTKDTTAPTVAQKFTNFNDGDTEDTLRPLANTNIRLVFSKQVGANDADGDGSFLGFLDLYKGTAADKQKLANLLRNNIQFYQVPTGGGKGVLAEDKIDHLNDDNWVIDYSKATVYQEGTNMVVEFPNNTAKGGDSALQLANGRSYYFVVSPKKGDIRDTTANHNQMDTKTLPQFTTLPAQINISEAKGVGGTINAAGNPNLEADFKFQFEPQSTSTAPEDVYYDIMIWCNNTLKFDLYTRSKENTSATWGAWSQVNKANSTFDYIISGSDSLYRTVAGVNGDTVYTDKTLRSLREDYTYQFAVHITSIGDNNDDRKTWNIDPEFRVTVASGSVGQLTRLANRKSEAEWDAILKDKNSDVESIGSPKPYYARTISISDTVPPVLSGNYPTFTDVLDHSATMRFQLNNKGTIYYVVTPVTETASGSINNPVPGELEAKAGVMNPYTLSGTGNPGDRDYYADNVPTGGIQVSNHNTNAAGSDEAVLKTPGRDGIITKQISDVTVRQGSVYYNGVSNAKVDLDDLLAGTWYYVYLMFEGNQTSEKAVCYKFKTADPIRPILNLSIKPDDKKTGSVTASVYASSGNVTARLIPKSDLPSSIFSLPFNMVKDGQTTSGRKNPLGFDFLNDEGKKIASSTLSSLTILDAMSQSVGSTGTASYFDTYASKELQAYVANGIKNGTVGGVAKWPDGSAPQLIRKDQTATMSFTLPNPNVVYFCVAVAENTTPGADHGFSAHPEVQIVDDIEPEASNYSGGLNLVETMTEDKKNGTRTYTYTLEGTLTIQYANFLYRYDSISEQALPFTQAGQPNNADGTQNPLAAFKREGTTSTPQDEKPSNANWYGVKGLYSDSGVTVVTSDSTPQLTREFTITVDINLGTRTVTKKIEYLTDSKGQVILDADGNPIQIETWPEPVKPTPTGRIGLPTDFVNRSNVPAKVKKNIEYTVDKNGNVKISLK